MLSFIVNQTSRSGKAAEVWQTVAGYLKEQKIEYRAFRTGYPGHASELAAKICRQTDDNNCLVIVGGDGTISETITGIYEADGFEKVRIAIIPAGSGNDFANSLKLPKDPVESLKMILAGMEKDPGQDRKLDLGRVSGDHPKADRIFGISCGFGMDAIVCKESQDGKLKKILNKFHMGSFVYILQTLYTLFSMKTFDVELTCSGDKGEEKLSFHKTIFIAAMNMRAEGGGVPMAPGALPDDGELSICCVHDIPKWLTFFYLPFLVTANHEGFSGVELKNCSRMTAHLSRPTVLHADGEYGGEITQLTVEVLRGIMHYIR